MATTDRLLQRVLDNETLVELDSFVTSGKTFDELEKELLNGQKLQGVATAEEIYAFLKARERLDGYPLFTKVYQICKREIAPKAIFEGI